MMTVTLTSTNLTVNRPVSGVVPVMSADARSTSGRPLAGFSTNCNAPRGFSFATYQIIDIASFAFCKMAFKIATITTPHIVDVYSFDTYSHHPVATIDMRVVAFDKCRRQFRINLRIHDHLRAVIPAIMFKPAVSAQSIVLFTRMSNFYVTPVIQST
jgi:hypothetical protein